ncbi:hypothetical protein VOLCADRAFT_117845, partial [Volvox carteri f. nagariensis]
MCCLTENPGEERPAARDDSRQRERERKSDAEASGKRRGETSDKEVERQQQGAKDVDAAAVSRESLPPSAGGTGGAPLEKGGYGKSVGEEVHQERERKDGKDG